MKVLLLTALLASCCSAAVTTLQIGRKYIPAECKVTTKPGDSLYMHYDGFLTDGSSFDSSRKRGQPFQFTLGTGQVIKGWDQGLMGMCVGEKRKLKIPPHLGYGESGSGSIPGNSVLIFDVELLSIGEAPAPPHRDL